MLIRFAILLAAGAFLLPSVSATPAGTPGLAIELRVNALVGKPQLVLADVATIAGGDVAMRKKLSELVVIQAPRVGYTERLTRNQIERTLRRTFADVEIAWGGADNVAVRVLTQTVPSTALSDAALEAATRQFSPSQPALRIAVASPPADLEIPAGTFEVVVRPLDRMALSARIAVWVDIVVNGAVYRSAVVQLRASNPVLSYVAQRDLRVGEYASSDDFAIATVDVAGINAVAANSPLQRFRLSAPIAAGQVLRHSAVAADSKIMPGDEVRLVMNVGQISVETKAIAMAEAVPGGTLRVRPANGTVVAGRLSAAGIVEIE